MISLTVLGATGSIGTSTLDLVRRNPDKFRIVALTANRSVEKLAALAKEFQAEYAAVADEGLGEALKDALSASSVKTGAGIRAVCEAADYSADRVMAAIVGTAGLAPTLTAIRRGATVMLANKECLVSAGDLFIQEAKKHNAMILPVDSEHNAIYQVFDADQTSSVSRLVLTASGGPFRGKTLSELRAVTPQQAVSHPNWSMGAKISVDSATLMNKGLEVIEAFYLFPVGKKQIEVVVHPQSVIHSMVEYNDGSVLAQMGSPDMRVPISYCMAWPERLETPAARLNFTELSRLDFEQPDLETFQCLALARSALNAGGTAPLILNAANEIAVGGFLSGAIGFLEIAAIVEQALERLAATQAPQSLETVFSQDQEARAFALDLINQAKSLVS